MISYSLASVVDTGDVLEVIDVVPNNTVLLEPGTQYVKLSAVTAEKLEDYLRTGKRCALPKGLIREAWPTDILVREAASDVEFNTVLYRSKIHDLFTESLLVGNIVQYYRFIDINNKLSHMGYYIHNDNREEIYIKIIETNDESLINLLEEYLEIKDILNILDWKMKMMEQFEIESKACETENEAKAVGEKYFNMLNDNNNIPYARYNTLPGVVANK